MVLNYQSKDNTLKIEVTGTPSKVDVELCKKAIQFYGQKLLSEKINDNIYLNLEFESFKTGACEYAFCTWEITNHNPRDFTITVKRNLSEKQMLLAIAHEMVHLKQYATGELKDYIKSNKKCRWMGKIFDTDAIEYWDHPWEIDAYGREQGLYFRFIESLNNELVP